MLRTALSLVLTTGLGISTAIAAPHTAQSMNPPAQPNASGCKLTYGTQGSGPLLQNVKVFDVFYNTGNKYRDMLSSYYTSITQSAYFDWLSEYNVGSYKIGRGSFIGFYEDSKSTTTSISLDDTDIGPYLDGLISAGKIPAPDANTIYQIYFPSNVSITLMGQQSCQVFCAYHNGWTHNGQRARYSVIPDVTVSPCAGGCGTSTNQFDNLTSVSSHELIEAVTDPDDNTAWVDPTQGCGEIGDICNGEQCKTAGGTPTTTCPTSDVVQLEWSNSLNACIAQNPAVMVNDFSVAVSPKTLSVPAGGMATQTLTLTKTAGSADTVKLTAMAPTGLTVSFSPTSATSAGGTSMVTVAAASTAMIGSMQKFTINAAGTTSTHPVDVQVTITAPPDMAMQPDMAQASGNGGSGGNGTGGNGNNGNGGSGGHGTDSGCSIGGGGIAGSWAFAGLILLALAFRRRRA